MTDNNTHRYELALEIGEEAVRQGKWQQAMTCFQTALTGLPHEPRIYNGLGDTHLALSDRARALACYKEAARLANGDPAYTEKVASLQERLGITADAAHTYLITGDILWQQGQAADAVTRWEQALRLQSDLLGAHERLAMACRQRGDLAGTARHYLALAEALRRDGRYLMALHICYTALSLLPENRIVWTATEQAWRAVAARDQASPYATRVEPGDLVNAAAEFAQWQLTAEFRQNMLRTDDPARARRNAHLRRAMLHEGNGQAGQAIAAYEKAIAAGLELPAIFFAAGLLYRLVGRRQDARAALTLAARHPFYRRAIALLE